MAMPVSVVLQRAIKPGFAHGIFRRPDSLLYLGVHAISRGCG